MDGQTGWDGYEEKMGGLEDPFKGHSAKILSTHGAKQLKEQGRQSGSPLFRGSVQS